MGRRRVARVKRIWRTLWDTNETTLTSAAGVTTNEQRQLLTAAELEDLDDEALIVRVVGELHYAVTESTAATGPYWWGVGVFQNVDGTAGPAGSSLGTISNVQDMSWQWIRTGALWGANVSEMTFPVQGFLTKHFDVRSKRKLNGGDTLVWQNTFINRDASASASFRYILNARILLEA